MGKRRQDEYGKRARREGYPARSVYKLEEIDRRTQLLSRGQRVLDLGAAPGSWTLYAAKKVGPKGSVLSIDLQPMELATPKHVELRCGDVREADVQGPFDVVLSDMAPKTSGQRAADQFHSFELYSMALEIAARTLRLGGAFVGKIFQGAEFEEARTATRAVFEKVRIIQPKATRSESYEVFLIGLGRRETNTPSVNADEGSSSKAMS